ncbi:MAG TPA: 1-acyl-sn-glycerol-3-phosphate acyltransferase [Candidatus Elarobacter sp.]
MSAYPPPGMLGPRAIAWWSLRTKADGVSVEGLERVPRSGPVLLVARHYHHLLDGAAIVHHLARPVHIVVGLDWSANASQRRRMERACAWARYPVILRPATTGVHGGYARSEVQRYVRSGLRDAAALLRDGRVVLVFPEGYPVIDPTVSDATPRGRDADELLPFAPGFRTIVRASQRGGARDVAVVPVGLRYEPRSARWRITVRFGTPLGAAEADVATVTRAVRELSR